MRIVAGEFGGRKLKTLAGKNTRPTTDKVKGAIFNMIGPYFDGGVVLDLFSGSGALGIEAISRGMERAVLVEKNFRAMSVIKENVAITKAEEQFTLLKMAAKQALAQLKAENTQFDLVLLDPPYAKQEIITQIEEMLADELLAKDAMIVCETDQTVELPEQIKTMKMRKRNVYGITAITIYDREDETE